uniref:Uncharacterized protein n=1 Tax=Oryza glumipatula TaxID=40148 RepID=A0A0D9YSV2_9ORYZ
MCRWPEEVEKQRQARRFRRCKRQGTQFGTGRRRLARWSAGCSRCRLVVHEAPVAQPLVDEFGWNRIFLARYGKLGNDNPYLSSWKRLRWPPDVNVRWCVGMESELFTRDGKLGNDNPLLLSSW